MSHEWAKASGNKKQRKIKQPKRQAGRATITDMLKQVCCYCHQPFDQKEFGPGQYVKLPGRQCWMLVHAKCKRRMRHAAK